jgi:hypothetical protein
MVDRVVLCARVGKLQSSAELERETSWTLAHRHAPAILEIVRRVYHVIPPSLPLAHQEPPPSDPSNSSAITADHDVKPLALQSMKNIGKRSTRTCSLCGNVGHNGQSSLFCCYLSDFVSDSAQYYVPRKGTYLPFLSSPRH